MKIIHCLGWFFPFSTGGTESYVLGLAQCQAAIGHTVKILVPRNGRINFPYTFGNLEVNAYELSDNYCSFLSRIKGFDLYHQHSLTSDCSAEHLSAARQLGLKTVFTAHVPGVVCLRGTLLEYGGLPCDGHIDEKRCSSCWAHSRGTPLHLSKLIPYVSISRTRLPGFLAFPPLRRLSTLLRAKQHVKDKLLELDTINRASNHVVAVCEWLYESLAFNGINKSKLSLSRQGLDLATINSIESMRRQKSKKVSDDSAAKHTTFGFIGRWDKVKGIDMAINAFKSLSGEISASLIIAATGEDADHGRFRTEILDMIKDAPDITLKEDISHEKISLFYNSIDVLLVPSKWLETGPLVVLEGVAAGLPVIGSSIGGIRELADIYENIYLASPWEINSWIRLMTKLAKDGYQKDSPRQRVRTSAEVAHEMILLYSS